MTAITTIRGTIALIVIATVVIATMVTETALMAPTTTAMIATATMTGGMSEMQTGTEGINRCATATCGGRAETGCPIGIGRINMSPTIGGSMAYGSRRAAIIGSATTTTISSSREFRAGLFSKSSTATIVTSNGANATRPPRQPITTIRTTGIAAAHPILPA